MKKVYKYGTGEAIPDGAVYLKTIVQTEMIVGKSISTRPVNLTEPCWFVWHYFLVETQ